MTSFFLGLEKQNFEKVCPFFVLFDSDLVIHDSGHLYEKILDAPLKGQILSDAFTITRPKNISDALDLKRCLDEVFFIRINGTETFLRGQLLEVESPGMFMFFGFPWIKSTKELLNLGLKTRDLPLHNPVTDYLFLLHTQRMHMADLESLSSRQAELMSQLENSKLDAESANYTKGQFLANMSHEIRTPLTSIMGFAEAASENGVSSEDKKMALRTILDNSNHLLTLINDILDISKIDANALQVEQVSFNPVALVERARRTMLPKIAEKGVSLIVKYEWELPSLITSDPSRLLQILLNLLSNAIKFTESGKIGLEVSCDREKEILHFRVKDTGIGMTEEQMLCIFDPFLQAEASTNRRFGGTGLGLAISKQIVERLGGEITVSSSVGEGSVFSFFINTGSLEKANWISEVPLVSFTSSESTETQGLRLQGKLLIVDDGLDNRKLLEFALRNTALQLSFAENGVEAIEAADSDNFDLILLDMQMPIMDGYTAAKELRKRGFEIPIIAFTANALKNDILKCLEAGCTAHLTKPFSRQALMHCLKTYLGDRRVESLDSVPVLSEVQESLEELKLGFLNGLIGKLQTFSDLCSRGDYKELQRQAHNLCGSAALFGYGELSKKSKAIEHAINNESLDECVQLLAEIERMLPEILS